VQQASDSARGTGTGADRPPVRDGGAWPEPDPTRANHAQTHASQAEPGLEFRPLRVSDADALCDLLLAARAVDGPRVPVARDELRHAWFDHPGTRLETDTLAAVTPDGHLAGAIAALARDAPTTAAKVFLPGAVHPAHRRRGIGTRLLRDGTARAAAILAAIPARDDLVRQVDCETPAGAADRLALFEREGYRRARSFLTMFRDLFEPIPVPVLPAPLTLTTWTPDLDDETRLAHNDAFRDHWGSSPVNGERWQHFVAKAPGFRANCSWLAVADSKVVGYSLATINDDPAGGRLGWLGTVGVRRGWRQRGVASALLSKSLESLARAGAEKAGLDVDAENPTGAVRVYTGLGFHPAETSIIYSRRIDA